jgi:hypothetical protein
MWRHITGVEQPAKKIKLDNNEKLERKRTYDQVKRKRKFQTSWQKNRMFHTGSGELLSPLSVRRLSSVVRPSVNFSHFNQLL